MTEQTGGLCLKDPNASDWPKGIDWTNYLAELDATETIASSSWAITGSDSALTVGGDSIVTGAKKTQVKLAGGTSGVRYRVTNSIVTSSGVHDDRSFYLLVQDL